MLASIVRLWAFSSASKSPMLVPASTLGSPLTAPVLTSSLSASVVFPQPPWPHKAMLRMPSTLYLDMPVSFYPMCRDVAWSLCRCASDSSGGKRVGQLDRSVVKRAANDAAGESETSEPAYIVSGCHAA